MQKLRLLFRHPDFVILILANMILGMAYSFVLPFGSLFGTNALGLTPMGLGLFMTANVLAGVAISTRLARWSDTRMSRKDLLIWSSAAGAAGYCAYAFIRDVRVLLGVGGILLGISGIAFSQTFALARDLLARRGVPDSEMPFYINIFRLCYALSWTVGPALGAYLLSVWSFRGTYLAAAMLFALFGMVCAIGLERLPPLEKAKAAAASMPLSKAVRLPGFMAHFSAFVLILACSTMGMMNLPLLIMNVLGGSERHVGMAYSLAPVFELPFMYFAGALALRIPAVRIIRWAAVLAVAYYAGLASAQAAWHVLPLQVLSAALVAVSSGLAITFFQDFLPEQPGTATNLYSNAARIGSLAGYLLFGAMGTAFGHRSVFWACAAFCAAAWAIMHRWRPVPASTGTEASATAGKAKEPGLRRPEGANLSS